MDINGLFDSSRIRRLPPEKAEGQDPVIKKEMQVPASLIGPVLVMRLLWVTFRIDDSPWAGDNRPKTHETSLVRSWNRDKHFCAQVSLELFSSYRGKSEMALTQSFA